MIASHLGWDLNPRILGVVPKEAEVGTLEGFHWVTDAQYWAIPKGVSNDKLAVLLDMTKYMLSKPAQAMTYDKGYFYPGPAVKDVPLSMAPRGQPEADRRIHPAVLRQADRRRAVGGAAAGRQAGLRVPALGPAGRRAGRQVAPRGDRLARLPRVAARPGQPRLRPDARAARRDADGRAGRVRRPARPVRLRQVHRAELHRRPVAADRRGDLAGRRSASTNWGRRIAASAWCSRTTRCSRT